MLLRKTEYGISISMLHKQHGMHPEMLRSVVLQGHPAIFESPHSSEETSDDLERKRTNVSAKGRIQKTTGKTVEHIHSLTIPR